MEEYHHPCLLTVRQFAAKHPAFSEGSLRWLIFQAGSETCSKEKNAINGLKEAIHRVGRRVLIDEGQFFDWVKRGQTQ